MKCGKEINVKTIIKTNEAGEVQQLVIMVSTYTSLSSTIPYNSC